MHVVSDAEATSLLEKLKAQDFRIHPNILQKAIEVIKEI